VVIEGGGKKGRRKRDRAFSIPSSDTGVAAEKGEKRGGKRKKEKNCGEGKRRKYKRRGLDHLLSLFLFAREHARKQGKRRKKKKGEQKAVRLPPEKKREGKMKRRDDRTLRCYLPTYQRHGELKREEEETDQRNRCPLEKRRGEG